MEDPFAFFPSSQAQLNIRHWVELERKQQNRRPAFSHIYAHSPLMHVSGDGLSHCLSSKSYPSLVCRLINTVSWEVSPHTPHLFAKKKKNKEKETATWHFCESKRISNMKWKFWKWWNHFFTFLRFRRELRTSEVCRFVPANNNPRPWERQTQLLPPPTDM